MQYSDEIQTIVGQLDVLLPIYFVVSLIPLLPYIRHIKKRTFAIIVLLLMVVLSLVSQSLDCI